MYIVYKMNPFYPYKYHAFLFDDKGEYTNQAWFLRDDSEFKKLIEYYKPYKLVRN